MILRRVEVFCFWQRQREVRQLPPGATSKTTLRTKVGVSRTTAGELSSTLGVKFGVKGADLSGQLGAKLSESLSITQEHEQSDELMLVNTNTHGYRRFAVWQEAKMLTVSTLDTRVRRLPAEYVKIWRRGLPPGSDLIEPPHLGDTEMKELVFTPIARPITYLTPGGATVSFKDFNQQ
jgi:hypothetical protein